MGTSGTQTSSSPTALNPDNALHLYDYRPPSVTASRPASAKANADMPIRKLPSIWSTLNLPAAQSPILPCLQADSAAMQRMSLDRSAMPDGNRSTAPSPTSILPLERSTAAVALSGMPAYASTSSSSSETSSPPSAHPADPPLHYQHPSSHSPDLSSQPHFLAQKNTAPSSTTSATSAEGQNADGKAPLIIGEATKYLDSQFHHHPAHTIKSKSDNVKAMTGEAGRAPTLVEIKKGLHTLSEQRRRWSINEGYDQLRAIVPHCDNGRNSGPVPKAAVLSRAASYIGDLTLYITQLREALKERDDRINRMMEATAARGNSDVFLSVPTRKTSGASSSSSGSSSLPASSAPSSYHSRATLPDQPAFRPPYPQLEVAVHHTAVGGEQEIASSRPRSSTFPVGTDNDSGRTGYLPPPPSSHGSEAGDGHYNHFRSGSVSSDGSSLKRKRSPLASEVDGDGLNEDFEQEECAPRKKSSLDRLLSSEIGA